MLKQIPPSSAVAAAVLALLMLVVPAGRALAAPGDRELERRVERQLARDAHLDASDIQVAASGTLVTLSGTAATLLARERAVVLAGAVEGGGQVVDALGLDTGPQLADTELYRQVRETLARDPVLDLGRIDIIVDRGNVTLSGTVDAWQQSQQAVRRARSVRGVVHVAEALQIVSPETRPDALIAAEIRDVLAWDPLLDVSGLEVAVEDGTVRLSGRVADAEAKNRAVLTAWTAGVRAVDASALRLDPTRATSRLPREPSAVDLELAALVEEALRVEPRVLSMLITVEVHHGELAVLRGRVPTLLARRAAESAALRTDGVRLVDSRELRVEAAEPLPDPAIDMLMRAGFVLDPQLPLAELELDVRLGVVTLEGVVESFAARARAELLAARLPGVVEIIDRLAVRQDGPDAPLVEQPERKAARDLRW